MDQVKIFRDLYEAQISDLNANRDQMIRTREQIERLRTELAIAEGNYEALQAKRRMALVSTKGVLTVIRQHEAAARAEVEAKENEQFNV